MKVDLYTTHCPKCKVLEKKLAMKNIRYEEHTDVDEMIKMGYKSAPILVVDGQVYSFQEAVKWVATMEG